MQAGRVEPEGGQPVGGRRGNGRADAPAGGGGGGRVICAEAAQQQGRAAGGLRGEMQAARQGQARVAPGLADHRGETPMAERFLHHRGDMGVGHLGDDQPGGIETGDGETGRVEIGAAAGP